MNNLSIDGINIIFNHSNVSPENFGILLRYIYGGNIELTNYDIPEILNILMVADKLGLTDLCDYIQDQLLDSKKELLKQNFVFVNRTSLSYGFEKLSTFCNEVLKQEPKIIFRSKSFTSFTSDELLSYYNYFKEVKEASNSFQIEQIELWERLKEWGICQLPNSEISKENFQSPLLNTLNLNQSSHPLESIEPEPLEMNSDLVTSTYFELFTKWINEINSKKNSFKFNLLLRGSYHGFNAKTFHDLCDYKGATITIVKVKNSNELIGGYNPINWFRGCPPGVHERAKNSFLFSLDQNDLNKSILSKVVDENNAIHQHKDFGPSFGFGRSDLRLYGMGLSDKKLCGCNKMSYERRIRSSTLEFGIEDYEVWQVVKE
ncbi:6351_t:CDS:2 [Diversispora eburnea]|uniref:6351_t:CDS:1 n=1 Tax=Diversispora eburnea TaxID=1213867 RepID=A0A9N9BUM5_9GLOM|nr:6351_t:CDS:2 [Diversispora eburnea]